MLLLLNQAWPWIFIGILLGVIGIININLRPKEWVEYLLALPFILIPDSTKTEKEQLDHQPVEEVVTTNPGCMLLLAGIIMTGYGLFRWLA